jgi:ParB-like chromosome segregation protein Spo0J/DNA-binding transcriptional regulator/RsmH inhibitor MraZ
MGRLTRRVKFLSRERRLSMPAEYLHLQGVQRGDHLMVSYHQGALWVFSLQSWERHRQFLQRLRRWYPSHDHPFGAVVSNGFSIRLGSQDRVVLPKDFPFSATENLRLQWELVEDVLRLEPEAPGQVTVPRQGRASPTQGSLLDYVVNSGNDQFDRGAAEQEFVLPVAVGDIDLDDRGLAEHGPFPDEALVSAIKVEGIRRPVLLARMDAGRLIIIDGFRRVAAARHLKLTQVPAVVLEGLSGTSLRKLRLLLGDHDDSIESPALNLLRSTLKLHEGQVELSEIEKITGRRKRTLQRYLRVAGDPVLRESVERGQISIFKAEEILKAGVDPETAIRKRWTVNQIRSAGLRRKRRRGPRPHNERES